MQANNVKVALKTEFGEYANVQVHSLETLQTVISHLQEFCGHSICIQNIRINKTNIDSNQEIIHIIRKALKEKSTPKFSNKTVCRLCAQTNKNLLNIFSTDLDYSEMIRSCFSIDVKSNDVLPTKICENCVETLIEFNKFKQKTIEAELKLKSYFKVSENLTPDYRNASEMLDINRLFENSEIFNGFEDTNDFFESLDNKPTDSNIDDHDLSNETPFRCKWCSKMYEAADDLFRHSLLHMTRSSKTKSEKQTCYMCTLCEQVFPVRELLIKHFAIHTADIDVTVISESVVYLDQVFSCNKCNAKFVRQRRLINHYKDCQSQVEPKNDMEKLWCIRVIPGMKFMCEFCKRNFSSFISLSRHKQGEDNIKSCETYSCEHCSRIFTTLCSYKSHSNSHIDLKKYLCDICGSSYGKSASLEKHILSHSANIVTCPVCRKKFRSEKCLKTHLKFHSLPKNCVCEICNKTFTSDIFLKKHKRLIHSNGENRKNKTKR